LEIIVSFCESVIKVESCLVIITYLQVMAWLCSGDWCYGSRWRYDVNSAWGAVSRWLNDCYAAMNLLWLQWETFKSCAIIYAILLTNMHKSDLEKWDCISDSIKKHWQIGHYVLQGSVVTQTVIDDLYVVEWLISYNLWIPKIVKIGWH